jgi:hypothetical protein
MHGLSFDTICLCHNIKNVLFKYSFLLHADDPEYAVTPLVVALRYKPEVRGFYPFYGH